MENKEKVLKERLNLCQQEIRLIRLLRQTKSDMLRIIVDKGAPVRVEEIMRDIDL